MTKGFYLLSAPSFVPPALAMFLMLVTVGTALGENAYVIFQPKFPGVGEVAVIDTASAKMVGKFTVAGEPSAIAVTPDGTKLLIVDALAGALTVVDASDHSVKARIPLQSPGQIVVTPDGSKAYVVTESSVVAVVDLVTETLAKQIKTGWPSISAITMMPNGKKLYIADGQYTVSAIDTASDSATAKIRIPPTGDGVTFPLDIAFLPDSSKAYVANYQNNSVSVIDTDTNKIVATIPTGREPDSIAVSPKGSAIYVAQSFQSQISVINPVTNKVTKQVKIKWPYDIALAKNGTQAYVTSDDKLVVLDIPTFKVAENIALGSSVGKAVISGAPSSLTVTVFPAARSVTTGQSANTVVTFANNSSRSAAGCQLEISAPSANGLHFAYQPIDAKGRAAGPSNKPVTIAQHGSQDFRVSFNADAPRTGGTHSIWRLPPSLRRISPPSCQRRTLWLSRRSTA
jgi:YVTN family beta-propeller protein